MLPAAAWVVAPTWAVRAAKGGEMGRLAQKGKAPRDQLRGFSDGTHWMICCLVPFYALAGFRSQLKKPGASDTGPGIRAIKRLPTQRLARREAILREP
jgi:hypothetical protein